MRTRRILEAIDDLKKLYGVTPYDGSENISKADGYFAKSLERKYEMTIEQLKEEVNFDEIYGRWIRTRQPKEEEPKSMERKGRRIEIDESFLEPQPVGEIVLDEGGKLSIVKYVASPRGWAHAKEQHGVLVDLIKKGKIK